MPNLYTIGHSNRSLEEFLALLHAHQITHIVDVRTVPKSRHVPWSNKTELKAILHKEKILYTHIPELGGLRHTSKESINKGWINASFRGFADYMQTREFYQALKKLNSLFNKKQRIAIMCAEALPWRCHRSLIADAEIIRGIKVFHIMSETHTQAHQLTEFAKINDQARPKKIWYPEQNQVSNSEKYA